MGLSLDQKWERQVGSAKQLVESSGFEFQFAEYLFRFQVLSVRIDYHLKKSLGIQQEIMMRAQKIKESSTRNLEFPEENAWL